MNRFNVGDLGQASKGVSCDTLFPTPLRVSLSQKQSERQGVDIMPAVGVTTELQCGLRLKMGIQKGSKRGL